MGDRSNIVIEDLNSTQRVYLYSHWDGERVIDYALLGLESGRQDDSPYLARIIFDAMTDDDRGGTTGYGISSEITDNEHPVLVISQAGGGTVWFEDEVGSQLSATVTHSEFVLLVKSTKNYSEKADENRLYEKLIKKMGPVA